MLNWKDRIRIKHVTTQQYLAIVPKRKSHNDADNVFLTVSGDNSNGGSGTAEEELEVKLVPAKVKRTYV